ncbi:hypothetical protein [Bacteroides sp.]
MKASVKFILTFVLLMLSFSMNSSALNCTDAGTCTCQISESSSSTCTSSYVDGEITYHNKLQTLSISDIELGAKPISESYSFSHNQRLRRVIEVSDFMKNIMQKLCLRENLLVLDKSKSFHSDKDPIDAQSSCEYYIFALRRILI